MAAMSRQPRERRSQRLTHWSTLLSHGLGGGAVPACCQEGESDRIPVDRIASIEAHGMEECFDAVRVTRNSATGALIRFGEANTARQLLRRFRMLRTVGGAGGGNRIPLRSYVRHR